MADWKTLVRARLAPLRMKPQAEAELADELAQHLEDSFRDLRSGGASEEDAYTRTIAQLDDVQPLRGGLDRSERMETHDTVPAGDANRGAPLEDLWRDLRYAARTIRHSPMFVLFVVLTLGLGIGANTTVFTLINTLIVNPLPVEKASELAAVATVESSSTSQSRALLPLSYVDLKDYQAQNEVFSSLAGYTSPRVVTWQANGASERMFIEFVTANYFSTLGLRAAAGRYFLPEEESTAGAHPVVVMNYGTWQTRFGGRPDIIGSELRLNNVIVSVIGVAPPGFIGVNGIMGPDVWIPAAMMEQLLPNQMLHALSDRGKAMFFGAGRLEPGVTLPQAQANLTTIASGLAREYPASNEGRTATVRSVRDVMFPSASGASPILFASAVLLIVVAIVLLIACSNVANLLLAHAAARQQEMAVRLAMGASRRRLVRQLLTESLLLGCLSGGVGLFIAYGGLQLLVGTLPASGTFVSPKLDATVLGFAFLISLATGFLFGVIPAFKASSASIATTLKEEGRTAGPSRSRVTLANVLLVGQVAFSFLLLVTAALFLRSMQRAYEIDPGFQTAHLAVFVVNPGQAGYGQPQTVAFYKDVRERVAALPGVESASWASNMPLWARVASGLQVEGPALRSRTDNPTTILNTIDRHYFETAGVVIERGREFTDLDQPTSLPVAIVNQKLVQDYWPNEDAVGKRIQVPGEKQMRQIVGIARTASYSSWGEPAQRCVYVPLAQNYTDAMTLYVRSKGDPEQILTPVERELKAVGPQVLMSGARTGRQIIDGGLFQARIGVALLSVFGLLALGLASIGLYGILAYSVSQRKREIGLRMALGADRPTVMRLVLRQGMSLVLTGVVIGFAAALVVARLLSTMLYGIGATDPASLAGAAAMLLSVALVACYLPARWATHVDPLVALREG
jgi:putative ABC transport system permease protein